MTEIRRYAGVLTINSEFEIGQTKAHGPWVKQDKAHGPWVKQDKAHDP